MYSSGNKSRYITTPLSEHKTCYISWAKWWSNNIKYLCKGAEVSDNQVSVERHDKLCCEAPLE